MERSVEVSVRIRTTPEKALDAFLREDDLRAWWGVELALVEPRVGGVYALAWGVTTAGTSYISSGIIGSLRPLAQLQIDHLVYFSPDRPILGPMRLRVDVSADGDGTLLRLVQDGYRSGADWEWYYEAVREAWPAVLRTLKDYLERGAA